MPVKLSPSRGAGVFTNRQREFLRVGFLCGVFLCRESAHERIPGILRSYAEIAERWVTMSIKYFADGKLYNEHPGFGHGDLRYGDFVGLCAGRHDIPGIDEYIFSEISDPTDFAAMYRTAAAVIPENAKYLHVFVTGLTAAMLAVVTVCQKRGICLLAYHYDRESGKYIEQLVLEPRWNVDTESY